MCEFNRYKNDILWCTPMNSPCIKCVDKYPKIYEKIKNLYETNRDDLKEVAEVLLDEAKLIEGLPVEDMGKFVSLATKYIAE